MRDVEGGIRAKVLAELMHHMISLHGKSSSAALPDPSGSKHDPAKISMPGGIDDIKHSKEASIDEVVGDGEEVAEHDLGDLFGRKKKSGSVEF